MKRIAICLLLLAAVSSCGRIDDIKGDLIGLRAGICEMDVTSNVTASPYRGTTPSTNNPLNAAVWFSNSSTEFLHEPVPPTYLPCHTQMTFESAAVKYADYTPEGAAAPLNLRYPTVNNAPVYCIGLYPNNGWQTTDGVNISHAIDGEQDIMFADVIEGTWDIHFPSQQYSHLLTWIKVSVCAMTMETSRLWGKVTEIKIKCKSSVDIDLSQASDKVTYGGEDQEITAFSSQTGLTLDLTSQEVGSVFCSPATEYEITVSTEYTQNKTLTVSLTDLNYQPITSSKEATGKLYILSLYFNPFSIIEGTCTLNYWNDQNEDLYLN